MARQKEEILFEWDCPREVKIASAKTCLQRWKIFLPKVVLTVFVVLITLCFTLNYLLPRDSGIHLEKLFIYSFLVIVLFLICICSAEYLSHMFSKTKYRVSSSRISTVGASFIRWKDITGYEIIEDKKLNVSWMGIFYHKGRFYRLICLPRDERSNLIIKYMAERVPLIKDIPEYLEIIKLSVKQKIWLCVITAIYSLGLSALIAFYGHIWVWLVLTVPYFGPGTIYLASVYKRRFLGNKSLKQVAIVFNLISGIFIMFLTFWLMIWQMKKEGGW